MITLDTSAIVALLDRSDDLHAEATETLEQEAPPYVVPAATLGEVGYFIGHRLGSTTLGLFLGDLESGSFALDCGEEDLGRIGSLTTRYDDLVLGLVDAAVIACAERTGGRVMTFDRRDFDVVGRELIVLP